MNEHVWSKSSLANLVEDTIGGLWGSPSQSAKADETDVLVVRGADFRKWNDLRARDAAPRRIPSRFLKRRQLAPGDLVVEVSGGGPGQPVGRVIAVDERAVTEASSPLICSNFCRKLRLKPEVDPFFVKRQLDFLYQSGQVDRFQTSSTNIRNLQVEDFLRGTEINFPPRDIQNRITRLLEAIDLKTATSKVHLANARKAVGRFRQAVLARAYTSSFGSGASEERQSVATVPLGELLDSLDQGWSPQCLNRPQGSDDEWAVIKTTAVQPLVYQAEENKALSNALAPRPALEVCVGDLLVTRAGPRSRVGVSCLVRKAGPRLMICDKVYRLRVDVSRALPEFVELTLNSPQIMLALELMKTGTSESGMNITQRGFLGMNVPLPPLPHQARITAEAWALLERADAIQTSVDSATIRLDRSAQATLAKAFQGELGNGTRT